MMRGFPMGVGAALLGCCVLPCQAQSVGYEGTAAARALDQQGRNAEQNNKYGEALKDFREAIALDENYADAYNDEIFVATSAANEAKGLPSFSTDAKVAAREKKIADRVTRNEVKEFERDARRHPDKPVYVWALAQIYSESDPLKEEQYCRQAVTGDSQFAPGYKCLAAVADLRGDGKEYAALLGRVAALEPESAQAAEAYAQALKSEPAAYEAALMRVVERFPADPAAAEAMYFHAMDQKTDAEKIGALEQLRQKFPPEKFLMSEIGMEALFRMEDRSDPAAARALADAMARLKPQGDDWAEYTGYADGVAKAEEELKDGHAGEALATLKAVKRPYYSYDMRREIVLNARALEASAGPAAAYAFLLDKEAEHPTEEVATALEACGARLGKSAAEIHEAVRAAVDKGAKPAIPFTLPGFDGGKPVSLADYRGHVVVVDFWFPNCGPCRTSFPYLEDLAQKYKDKGVVVLAINGMKGQEAFVLPFLRSQGYEFVPLEADEGWAFNVYHVSFYPTSFLIGRDGRQYYAAHHNLDPVEEENEALEIDELLAHSG